MAALNHARVFYHKLVDKNKEPDFARFCRNIEASGLFNFPHPFKQQFEDDDFSSTSSDMTNFDFPRRRGPPPRKSKYTETTNREEASEKDIESWFDIKLQQERKMTKKEQKTASKKKKKKKNRNAASESESVPDSLANGTEEPAAEEEAVEVTEGAPSSTEDPEAAAEDATSQLPKKGRVRVQNRFAPLHAMQTVITTTKGEKEKAVDISDPKVVFSVVQEKFRSLDSKAADEFDAYLCCQECMENRMEWMNITPKVYKHNCGCDVLLLKRKREREWTRVRHCPIINRPGHFELCVRVERGCTFPGCTFPHSELEKHVWEMEREGIINLKGMPKKFKMITQQVILDHLKNIRHMKPNFLQTASSAPTWIKLSESSEGASPEETAAIERAFQGKYEFRLGCHTCFPLVKATLHKAEKGAHARPEMCAQTVLFARETTLKEEKWWRVRKRQSQNFQGSHLPCHYGYGEGQMICRKGDQCTFPHNEIELALWEADRSPGSTFSIESLVRIRKQNKIESVASLVEDVKKANCSGTCAVEFLLVCHACLEEGRIAQPRPGANKCQLGSHPLKRVLVARGKESSPDSTEEAGGLQLDVIREKPERDTFELCDRIQCEDDLCPFAHSLIELDVWNTEQRIKQHDSSAERSSYSREMWEQTQKPPVPAPAPVVPALAQQQHALFFPYPLRPVCATCFLERPPRFSGEKKKTKKCEKGHTWVGPTYVSGSHKIRSPQNLCSEFYNLCNSVPNGKCQKGAVCSFAHSEAERDIWIWMRKNKIGSLDEIFKRCTLPTDPSSVTDSPPAKVIPDAARNSDVSALPHGRNDSFLANNAPGFYCNVCQRFLPDQRQYDKHVESKKHKAKCDRFGDYPWNYRAPELRGKMLRLCPKHLKKASCKYSNVENDANRCPDAHSQEELDEWNERVIYLRFQAKKGPEFAELEEYIEGIHDLMYEIKDSREGVSIFIKDSPNDPRRAVTNSDTTHLRLKADKKSMEWLFEIETNPDITVTKAFLLNDRFRHHFVLKKEEAEEGKQLLCWENEPGRCRIFWLSFVSNITCPYTQQLVLHFGDDVLVMVNVYIEFASEATLNELEKMVDVSEVDRWTEINVEVVRDKALKGQKSVRAAIRNLGNLPALASYLTSKEKDLTPENYVNRMTLLLHLEEAQCNQLVSSFNLKGTEITIADRFESNGHLCFADSRTFFGRIPLTQELCENGNPVANLFLDNVRFAWIRGSGKTGPVVECHIVDSEGYGFDGRGRDYLWIVIPRQALELFGWQLTKSEENVTVDCQFQHDPQRFDLMHAALKRVPLSKEGEVRVMPRGSARFRLQENVQIDSRLLNEQQKNVLKHILSAKQGDSVPPLIICGSFGAGKTQTLGQALLRLRNEKKRVLVCTHANSAADLYITRILDDVVKQSGDRAPKVLRIYYERRQTKHIAQFEEVMRNYCLKTNEQGFFNPATREDIENAQIIITTLQTAYQLYSLDLPPETFTHILIDEAAQVLEAEALIPMGLAGPNTMLVLAGDPIQMQPVVHSQEAVKGGLQRSILERLWSRYEKEEGQLIRLRVLMTVNYRSEPDLVNFISTVFYKSDKLTSNIKCSLPSGMSPLTLVAVPGTELKDQDSTSRCNEYEAIAVEAHVKRILKAWPGLLESEICVISAFYTQVRLIRHRLRKSSHKGVVVQTIRNVQGREFRVIIISCVRTREGLTSGDSEKICSDFLTDLRLINTAFTRAKSAVAVIADPVALLGIGNCANIWHSFIATCESRRSLLPPGTTATKIHDEFKRLKEPHKFPFEPKAPMSRPNTMHAHKSPSLPSFMNQQAFMSVPNFAPSSYHRGPSAHPGNVAGVPLVKMPNFNIPPQNFAAAPTIDYRQFMVPTAKPQVPMTTAPPHIPSANVVPQASWNQSSAAMGSVKQGWLPTSAPQSIPRTSFNTAPATIPNTASQPVPFSSAPQQRVSNIPQQPVTSMSQHPAVSIPQQPVTGMPQQPITSMPQQPAVSIPQQPVTGMPQQIVTSMPQQPAVSMSQKPAVSMPQQPAVSMPQHPAVSMPQQPVASMAQQPSTVLGGSSKASGSWTGVPGIPVRYRSSDPPIQKRVPKPLVVVDPKTNCALDLKNDKPSAARTSQPSFSSEELHAAAKRIESQEQEQQKFLQERNVQAKMQQILNESFVAQEEANLAQTQLNEASQDKEQRKQLLTARDSAVRRKSELTKQFELLQEALKNLSVSPAAGKAGKSQERSKSKDSSPSSVAESKDVVPAAAAPSPKSKNQHSKSAPTPKPLEASAPALNVAAALQAKVKPSSEAAATAKPVEESAASGSSRRLRDLFDREESLQQEKAQSEKLLSQLMQKVNALSVSEVGPRNRNNNSVETGAEAEEEAMNVEEEREEEEEEEEEELLLQTPALRRAIELSERVIERMGRRDTEQGALQVTRESCGCVVVGFTGEAPGRPWLQGLAAQTALREAPFKFQRALVLNDGRLRLIDTADPKALSAWLESPLPAPQPLPGAPGDELLLDANSRAVVGVLRPTGSWALAQGGPLDCRCSAGNLFTNGELMVRNLVLQRVHQLCCRAKSALMWREAQFAFKFLQPTELQARVHQLRYLGPGPCGPSEPLALLSEVPPPPVDLPDLALELQETPGGPLIATGLQTLPGAPLQVAFAWQPTTRRLQVFVADPWRGLDTDSRQALVQALLQFPEADHLLVALQTALQFSSVEPRPALGLTFEAYRPLEEESLVADLFGGAANGVPFLLRLASVDNFAVTLGSEVCAWKEEMELPELRLLLLRSILFRHGTGALATALAEAAGPGWPALTDWGCSAAVLRMLAELELVQFLQEAGRPLRLPFRRFLFCQAAAAPIWQLRALPAARSAPALKPFLSTRCRFPADLCTCTADADLPAAPVPVPATVALDLRHALDHEAWEQLQRAALDWTNFPAAIAHLNALHEASFTFTEIANVKDDGISFPNARLSLTGPLERLTDLLAVAAAGGAAWDLPKGRLAQVCLWQDARDRGTVGATRDAAFKALLPTPNEPRDLPVVFCGLEDNGDLRFALLCARAGPIQPLELVLPADTYLRHFSVQKNAVPHHSAHLLLAQGAQPPQNLETDLFEFRLGLLAPSPHFSIMMPDEVEALLQVALGPSGDRQTVLALEGGLACLSKRLQASPQPPAALLLQPGLVLSAELVRAPSGLPTFRRLAHFDLEAPPEKAQLQRWLEDAMGTCDESPNELALPTKPVVWRQRAGRTEGGELTNLRMKELPEAGAGLPATYGRSARDESWCRDQLEKEERDLWDGLSAGYGNCVIQAWDKERQPRTLFANVTKVSVRDKKVTIEFQVHPEHEGDELGSEAKMVLSLMSSKRRAKIRALHWLTETRQPMSDVTRSLLTAKSLSSPHMNTYNSSTDLRGLNIFTGDPDTSTLGAMLKALLHLVAKEEPKSCVMLCNFDASQLAAIREGSLPERKILELTERRSAPVKDVVAMETSSPADLDPLLKRLRKADLLVGATHLASDPLLRYANIQAAVLLKAVHASESAPLLALPSLKHLVVCAPRRLAF